MNPAKFVRELASLRFANTFNPYHDKCDLCDVADAPRWRAKTLRAMLAAADQVEIDAIWIGRDLGYRGGRRTGLALTDDVHMEVHAARWGVGIRRATKGQAIAERTAAVIWNVLIQIPKPIFLWNVFPVHPHEEGDPFTNRSHNAREREAGEELLAELIKLLRPQRLIAIGNDAALAASRVATTTEIIKVRHPSYGGQSEFLNRLVRCTKCEGANSTSSPSVSFVEADGSNVTVTSANGKLPGVVVSASAGLVAGVRHSM